MIISYAQNFEDVMLERAFANVEAGFWIDVGAWDPDVDSVTRHFSDRGWRGVNCEPNPHYFNLYRDRRPRDINLGLAIGSKPGRASMTLIHGTGMSTFDRSIAAGHAKLEYRQEETEVEIRTLDSIFKEYAPADVHFLKIDCEGAEPDVIASCDFRKHRPWIILVESTLPLTREETHGAWEPALLAAGYRFVYFDGVNRFYVSEEHADLKRHFETPPNVFDGFMVDRMMQHGAYLEDLRRAEARAKKGWFARLFS
ncbi:MAG: FkbM family methyltransferase [Beijerinckiaceae bacterium]